MQKFFLFSCLLFISSFVHAARFVELGQLNGEALVPTAISNGGRIVAGTNVLGSVFTWSADAGVRSVPSRGYYSVAPPKLTPDGSIVVGMSVSDFSEPFPFTGFFHSTTGNLSPLNVLPTIESVIDVTNDTIIVEVPIRDISADGSAYIQGPRRVTSEGIDLLIGGTNPINRQERILSSVAISGDGSTVIGVDVISAEALAWTEETGVFSLDLPGVQSIRLSQFANAVSADGSTIVGSLQLDFDLERQPFIWTPDDLLLLDVTSSAIAVSDDGSIILLGPDLSFRDPTVVPGSFLWTKESGVQTLESILAGEDIDLSLVGLTPTALSPDGDWITVLGQDIATNMTKTYLVNISSVPVPGAFWLFGSGFLALVVKKRFLL